MRTPLAIALAVVTLAFPAHATSAHGCPVLRDPAGDQLGPGGVPAPRELDLLAAGLRLQGSTLTATLQVSRTEDTTPTSGETWQLSLSDGSRVVDLIAMRGPDGDAFSAYGGAEGPNQPYLGDITGRVDVVGGTVELVAPMQLLGIRPTTQLHRFEAWTTEGFATSGAPLASTPLAGRAAQATGAGTDQASVDRDLTLSRCR